MPAFAHGFGKLFTKELTGTVRLDLSFRNPGDEREYREFVLGPSVSQIRLAYYFALCSALGYTLLDPVLYDDRSSLLRAYFVRFTFLVPSISALLLATYMRWYRGNEQKIGSIVVLVFGSGCFLLAYDTNQFATIDNYSSIIMVMIYAFFFTGLLFRYSMLISVSISALYIFAVRSVELPPVIATSLITSLCVILIFLALAAYQKEFSSRQLYLTEIRERQALAHQSQSDGRTIEWLRILATFLRHEVRQPVAQINSSIEVVKILEKHDQRVSKALDNATSSARHLWNLIDRACRATDIEAYVREGRPVQIDLNALLGRVVGAYRQSSSGVEFHFHCAEQSAPVPINADATLIEEAVRNLLNNAESYADDETTVSIGLTVDASDAVITVRNSGPLAPDDTAALFGPFASTRSTPSGEHHGLGLYLVRLVAEQHGGRAELVNLDDGSGVQVSIRLPLALTGLLFNPPIPASAL